jgi:hypothetical protein
MKSDWSVLEVVNFFSCLECVHSYQRKRAEGRGGASALGGADIPALGEEGVGPSGAE